MGIETNIYDHTWTIFWTALACLAVHEAIILFILPKNDPEIGEPIIHRYAHSSVFERLAGSVLLGIVPLGFLIFMGIDVPEYIGPVNTLLWPGYLYVLGGVLIILILTVIFSGRMDLTRLPSIMKYQGADIGWYLENSILWALYLFAYELLLRGFLFFTSLELFGLTTAIILNCIIYALIHIPKGRSEAIGAIPFGIILCLITLQTGSVWGAFIMHLTLAISMDWQVMKVAKRRMDRN